MNFAMKCSRDGLFAKKIGKKKFFSDFMGGGKWK